MATKKIDEEVGMSAAATSSGGQGILSGPEDQTKDGVLGPTNFNMPTRLGAIKKRLLTNYVYSNKKIK